MTDYGVVVGRFQVHELHEGHLELFRMVGKRHGRVIVFLGVPPTGPTRRNPLDFETRKCMIEAKFPNPKFTVLPLKDQMYDELWSAKLDERIREVAADFAQVTLYGGRDSYVPSYTGIFRPYELPILVPTSGEDVRARLTNTVMESADFRAGIIYSAQNQFARTITCVDVAILHRHGSGPSDVITLLAKKPGERSWRFVGGHADPASPSFEDDAKREAFEETGLDVTGITYLGSAMINDWRWKKETDKVKTLFFFGFSYNQGAKAMDDIAQVQWFPLLDVLRNKVDISPLHQPLRDMLTNHFKGMLELAAVLSQHV